MFVLSYLIFLMLNTGLYQGYIHNEILIWMCMMLEMINCSIWIWSHCGKDGFLLYRRHEFVTKIPSNQLYTKAKDLYSTLIWRKNFYVISEFLVFPRRTKISWKQRLYKMLKMLLEMISRNIFPHCMQRGSSCNFYFLYKHIGCTL